MRIFNRIIQDSKAPNTFDLWINKGRLKYFNGGWKDLGGSEQVSWNDIQGKPNLSAVATSGSYNDLSDKPTIPPAYSLPIANANTLGGVKSATTGTTSGRDYNVQINADGTMKVNVPWVDLNTTYAKATDTTLGLVMIGYTENGKNYPVELDGDGKMYVNVPWTNTTYSVATQSANGLMSSSDKTKLDNLIEVPTGGTTGQVLKKTADGVAWQNDNNTTYSVASGTTNGLMSSTDKSKLDNIAENANNYTLPNATAILRGGVLMAGAVADTTVDGTETATTVATTLNSLLAALRAAGVLTA
jgi:hypothetical protein